MAVLRSAVYGETVERIKVNLIFSAFMGRDPQAREFQNASNRALIEREILYIDSDGGELRGHHSFTMALNQRMRELLDANRAMWPDDVAEIESNPLHIGAFAEAFIAYRQSLRDMAMKYCKLSSDELDSRLDAGETFADIFDSLFEENKS